jgi:hypothetical protein
MAVDEDFFGLCELRGLVVGGVLDEEFAEEKGLVPELRGAWVVGEEVGELVAEDGGAAWLEDDDGCAVGELRGEGVEDFEKVVFGGVEHAEVVKGTTAAEMSCGDGNAEAGGG